MTYETMLIILAGGSKKIVAEYEKAMKNLVVSSRAYRQK